MAFALKCDGGYSSSSAAATATSYLYHQCYLDHCCAVQSLQEKNLFFEVDLQQRSELCPYPLQMFGAVLGNSVGQIVAADYEAVAGEDEVVAVVAVAAAVAAAVVAAVAQTSVEHADIDIDVPVETEAIRVVSGNIEMT